MIFLLPLFSVSELANAQFSHDEIVRKSVELQPAIYLRDFNMEIPYSKKGKMEHSKVFDVVLNVGTTYGFALFSSIDGKPAVCEISSEKGEILKTIHSPENKQSVRVDFLCPKTQVYKLKFYFKENVTGSILGILFFVKAANQQEPKLVDDGACGQKLLEKAKDIQKGIYILGSTALAKDKQIDKSEKIVLNAGNTYRMIALSSSVFSGISGGELLNDKGIVLAKGEFKINRQSDYFEFKCSKTEAYTLHLYAKEAKEGCISVFVYLQK